ncbi:RNA polymerase sigma-70 factor [Pedobacter frigoris]|uniref:RNA polymerase sigma factor n=1 Tax=Pedobacter frigoris TaxID=2571272 RepID=UPI0029310688|nr:RNA polymerase sigma-70 factor [Pedobacter frigoris]
MVTYHSFSENELIELVKSRDEIAFREIYERYWNVLYFHVFKMLKDEEEAKDLIQELFSTLWLNPNQIHSSTNLSGFLYVSARNRVLNLIQHNKVKNQYLTSLAHFADASSNVTLEQLDEQDLLNALEKEISALPAKMKQVFELSRKQNLSYKEIAAELNISEKTVKKQISNALKIIKNKLAVSGGLSILYLALFR